MIDDKDERLSDRYRQASREASPAGTERAVMELVRKSVQRRTLAPFGNHRVTGTLAGIGIVSLLLVLLLPEQAGVPELPQSLQDADSPVTELQQQRHQLKSEADEDAGALQTSGADRPEPARGRFDFYSTLPEAEHETPVMVRSTTPAAPPVQEGPGVSHMLQIEGFASLVQAESMQDKLAFMRLDSRIRQDAGAPAGYRILVGPYTDLDELDRVQAQLHKRGIRTTRKLVP